MTKNLLTTLSAIFQRLFPERQFYHRSHGEVHFVSLSGRTQMIYLSLTLVFLTWVGFASVNVVFKEQIISEKERDYIVMEKQYEARLAELEKAYDEVNSVLVLAEERFQESTRSLERRHEQLKSLVEMRQALNSQFSDLKETHFAERREQSDAKPRGNENQVLMRVTELEPTERLSRRMEVHEESPVAAVTTATATLGRMIKSSVKPVDKRGSLSSRVASLQTRVEVLRDRQRDLVFELEEKSQSRIAHVEAILGVTGLPVTDITGNFANEGGAATGGPLIALGDDEETAAAEVADGDPLFRRQIYRLAGQLEQLTALESAIVSIPLVNPVNDDFDFTSTFGPRVDPFSRRRAFHSGLDMAGKRGATVVATAPGVVTYAGPKGPYGNLVEIDHGHGFKTRYGHLSKIMVKRGEDVDFYQQIATLGSTGRSTGPHLHYEVWFNKKVRDPAKFFEAGSYVFKE